MWSLTMVNIKPKRTTQLNLLVASKWIYRGWMIWILDIDDNDINLDKLEDYDGKITVGISEVFLRTSDSMFAMPLRSNNMDGNGGNDDQMSFIYMMSQYRNEEEENIVLHDSYRNQVDMNELKRNLGKLR